MQGTKSKHVVYVYDMCVCGVCVTKYDNGQRENEPAVKRAAGKNGERHGELENIVSLQFLTIILSTAFISKLGVELILYGFCTENSRNDTYSQAKQP